MLQQTIQFGATMSTGKNIIKSISTEQKTTRKKNLIRSMVNQGLLLFYGIGTLLLGELKSKVDLSVKHTVKAWRHGFVRLTYRMYGFDRSGISNDYLSDYQAVIKISKINGKFDEILTNKLAFSLWLKQLEIPQPEIIGVIRKGRFFHFPADRIMGPAEFLKDGCKTGEQIVLKPIWHGAHGMGVFIIARSENGYQLNGEDISKPPLNDILCQLDNYMVTEFIRQAEYAAGFFPDSTNTIRILTIQDVESSKSVIARAVHRIGTSRTRPLDNFKAGHGGLSALIDPDTGKLGPGAMVSPRGKVTWHPRHPESRAPIQDVIVPAWMQILTSILEYANLLAFVPNIAWDIVATYAGFSIIEANPGNGMPVLQVHGPMLTDPQITRFYRYHRVIT